MIGLVFANLKTRRRKSTSRPSCWSRPCWHFWRSGSRVKDPAWRALLGSWVVGAGCLRYHHVQVSVPRKITTSTFHAFCVQGGKQAQNREWFYWCVPSTFTTHRVLQLVGEIATYETWEHVLAEADLKAKKAVDQAVARDRHVVWSSSIADQEVQTRCKLSEELTASAVARERRSQFQMLTKCQPSTRTSSSRSS